MGVKLTCLPGRGSWLGRRELGINGSWDMEGYESSCCALQMGLARCFRGSEWDEVSFGLGSEM